MVKSISTDLTTAIESPVTTLALLVEIVRPDYTTYRLTSHDTNIVFNGHTYRADIAFSCSSFVTGSALNVDNVTLSLALDDSVFSKTDFINGLFAQSEVTIRKINYADPADGSLVMRKGWFSTIEYNQQGYADITVVGLLKTLEFNVGHIYQPSCNADLGDKRCKVAIDFGQAYSARNPYTVGDWVYNYDVAELTPFTVVNPSFEADGARTHSQDITGWTKVMGTYGRVRVDNDVLDTSAVDPVDGSWFLMGYTEDAASLQREERYLYQDLDLVAGGISALDLDAGKIVFMYQVALLQSIILDDPVRLRMDVLNADGDVIDTADTRFITLDEINEWRDRSLCIPLIAGSRTVRIYIYFYRLAANIARCAADDVRCYYWDHTATTPTFGVIHKVARTFDPDDENYMQFFKNGGFEVGAAAIANSGSTTIPEWMRPAATDFWRVNSGGIVGSYYLVGGDDGSGIQKTYTLTQTVNLETDWGLLPADVDLQAVALQFQIRCRWLDADSSMYVYAEFIAEDGTTVIWDTDVIGTSAAYVAAPSTPTVTEQRTRNTVIPALTRSIKLYLNAKSPAASSDAQVGFDDIKAVVLFADTPLAEDPSPAFGAEGTEFSYASGDFTLDGDIVWKAFPLSVSFDTVAAVSSTKQFTATTMAGVDDLFTSSLIKWLTGANAGRKNVIRTWNGTTKVAKLYFHEPNEIQVGDRFQYVLPCHKRFNEDCVFLYDNGINFRGFPHLPGRLATQG